MKKVLKGLWLALITPFHVLLNKRHSHKNEGGTRTYYNQPFYKRLIDFFLLILLWPVVIGVAIQEQFKEVQE